MKKEKIMKNGEIVRIQQEFQQYRRQPYHRCAI